VELMMNEKKPDLTILFSNDLHSRLEQGAQMAGYFRQVRARYGAENVLTLDMGDHMDRMRMETEGSNGLANVAMLQAAGYDAVTLGNNEGLTFTFAQLNEVFGASGTRAVQRTFAVVCANLLQKSNGERPAWMVPHLVLHKGSLRIGLIGVTAAYPDYYGLIGWEALEPLQAVREQVAQLRAQVDLLIVMSHLGLPKDIQIAETTAGIDWILGGHTHHRLDEPKIVNGTRIMATGKYGEAFGVVHVYVEPVEYKKPDGKLNFAQQVLSYDAKLLDPSEMPEDEPVAEMIAQYHEQAAGHLARVVAHIDAPLGMSLHHEMPLTNVLVQGVQRVSGAEFSLVNNGQLLGGLPAGDVTEGQLHQLCPSPINVVKLRLAGSDVRRALEESLLIAKQELPLRGYGFRGVALGALAVEGLTIQYDLHQPEYERITKIEVDGAPFDDERIYAVGTVDMFVFGIGYLSLKKGTDVEYFLPDFLRHILAEELRRPASRADSVRKRWLAVHADSG
jgi:2',3'-cyclic-nucleotide 2'-phosphodiesterase (5'-nucleotidase family)